MMDSKHQYNIKYLKVQGQEIKPYVQQIAHLRIEVFKEWPYLYEGSLDYEANYLRRYTEVQNSLFILAFDNEQLIGASSCLLLSEETDSEIVKPFIENNFSPAKVVYYGESLLKSKYRGAGIGSEFMRLREDFARSLNADYVAFCAVVRPEIHSLKPADYKPLASFWAKKGFQPQGNMVCHLQWKDLDQKDETKKELQFWLKPLKK